MELGSHDAFRDAIDACQRLGAPDTVLGSDLKRVVGAVAALLTVNAPELLHEKWRSSAVPEGVDPLAPFAEADRLSCDPALIKAFAEESEDGRRPGTERAAD